jgi:hypothetical protein
MLFRGVSMEFRSLQLVSKAAMNMNGIIFFRILFTYNEKLSDWRSFSRQSDAALG